MPRSERSCKALSAEASHGLNMASTWPHMASLSHYLYNYFTMLRAEAHRPSLTSQLRLGAERKTRDEMCETGKRPL